MSRFGDGQKSRRQGVTLWSLLACDYDGDDETEARCHAKARAAAEARCHAKARAAAEARCHGKGSGRNGGKVPRKSLGLKRLEREARRQGVTLSRFLW